MHTILSLSLVMMFSLSYPVSAKERPKRGENCQRMLVKGRHLDTGTKVGQYGYGNSFEENIEPGGNDWDGTYPANNARDPGGF